VQDILGVLIIEKKLKAQINQENGTVIVEREEDGEHVRRLHDWTEAISDLCSTVLHENDAFRLEESQAAGGAFVMPGGSFDGPMTVAPQIRGGGGRGRASKGGKSGKMSAWSKG